MTKEEAYNEYIELIERLKVVRPVGLFNDLVIRNHYKNKRISPNGMAGLCNLGIRDKGNLAVTR